jgi:choline dehydrogenase-like flavoprotein
LSIYTPEADYVVVGAGSSGCALVHRLSLDPSIRILLLEAGVSGETDPAILAPGQWVSLIGSSYDWNYTTDPEPGLNGRRIAVPRGKVHGGSSAINAMVHIRGSRSTFDGWCARGNPGWGYDEVAPFFERSHQQAVTQDGDPHDSHLAFLEAAAQLGFDVNRQHDFNGPDPLNVAGFLPKNILNGRRHSSAAAFLEPARRRENVEVLSAVHATRLWLEGRRVVGVEYARDGRLERVRARREVVLSAGAIDTPKLLMLSGIGAADDLRMHGIAITADLPGVGRNLQDHLKLSMRWKGKTTIAGSTIVASLFTSSASERGDLQVIVGRGLEQPDHMVTIAISHLKPRSRGSVALGSASATTPPIIRANYLTEAHDVAVVVEGIALARRFGESRAYDRLRAEEIEPGPTVHDLAQFARQKADSIYHAAGTCRMGPASDRSAVVDHELRVYGIEGVRIADASIMPEIVSAPTHAACAMIGEKCAALIADAQ